MTYFIKFRFLNNLRNRNMYKQINSTLYTLFVRKWILKISSILFEKDFWWWYIRNTYLTKVKFWLINCPPETDQLMFFQMNILVQLYGMVGAVSRRQMLIQLPDYRVVDKRISHLRMYVIVSLFLNLLLMIEHTLQ